MKMDNTKMLLSELGVPEEFIVNFRENQISLKDLDGVENYILKELIPPIKIRMKVLKELKKLKYSDEKFSEVMSEVSSISTSNRSEILSDVDQSFDLSNVTFGGLENFLFKPRFPEFDLKTLLSTSPLGNTVLDYYDRFMKLDETRRNRLVDIIVKHIFNFIVKSRLKHDEYNLIAAEVITLFPKETMGTYYVPPVKKRESVTGKSIPAKGKLVDKRRNILHKAGERVNKRKSQEGEQPVQNKQDKAIETLELNTDLRNDVLWLQNNQEPWSTVIEKWNRTFELRQNSEQKTVADFFGKWTILSDLRSDILINLDFEKLYPQSHMSFYLNWESFFGAVLSEKENELKDAVSLELFGKIKDSADNEPNFSSENNWYDQTEKEDDE